MKTVEVVFDIPLDKTFDYLPGRFLSQILPGVRVRVPFGRQKKVGFVVSVKEQEDRAVENYREIIAVYDGKPLVTDELLQTAGFIKERYFSSFGQAVFSIIGSLPLKYEFNGGTEMAGPETLCVKGGVFSKKYILFRDENEKFDRYNGLISSINDGSVLLLFPEVSQAEYFHERMKGLHGSRAVLFHGGLKNKEKAEHWFRMLNERKLIAVGTRLAVFAPLRDLENVIIDNGHNSSYREQQTPKYDAARTAEFRCEYLQVPLTIGEESLSVSEYFSIANRAAAVDHINGRELPPVLTAGMTRPSVDKNVQFLTRDAVSMLEETVLKGGKVAVIHNRKGSSKVLKCEKCDNRFLCSSCGSGMVLSEDGKSLLCRFCKTAVPFEKKCPSCGSRKVGVRLYGIEKMFRTLREQYPEMRISRYTAETGGVEEEFDVIVGTGIVRKLLGSYPFQLVVFVSGESFLNTPEYRSEENFFIMVNEMRSSITDSSCRILIQTRNPNLEIYRSLRENKPEIFYAKELGIRKHLGYPPFSEIIKIELKGRKKDVIRHKQETIEAYLKEREIEIIYSGPSFPPVRKGKDVWKYLFRAGAEFDREEFGRMAQETGISAESNPDHI